MPEIQMADVVILTRIRLCRNFRDLPFPVAMKGEDGIAAQNLVLKALSHQEVARALSFHRIHNLPDIRRRTLKEKHLISRELLSAGADAALLLHREETASILLNEEDHLRILALMPGRAFVKAEALAFAMEEAIGCEIPFAFDDKFGYLTSNPAHAGTGMGASVLLHLPGLTRTRMYEDVAKEVRALNHMILPLKGEDGKPQGDLYIMGNQGSMGLREEEMLELADAILTKIVGFERRAREILFLQDDGALKDRLLRSFGVLCYAGRLSYEEFMHRYSDVRLAILGGMIPLSLGKLDDLLIAAKPAHVEMAAGKDLSPQEREDLRARLVREALAEGSPLRPLA